MSRARRAEARALIQPCFTVPQDDSSRSVTEKGAECNDSPPPSETAASLRVPTTSDDALRLAVKLAVDAGEYERAALVLDVLGRITVRGTVSWATTATQYAFEHRSVALFAINAGYSILGMSLAGAVVGAWKEKGEGRSGQGRGLSVSISFGSPS